MLEYPLVLIESKKVRKRVVGEVRFRNDEHIHLVAQAVLQDELPVLRAEAACIQRADTQGCRGKDARGRGVRRAHRVQRWRVG